MAQHIPISTFKQKAFRTIGNGIDSAFAKSKGLLHTSMKYVFVGMQDGKEVFQTVRKIPKGIVYNSEEATIEIHFNKEKKIIEEIYLVA